MLKEMVGGEGCWRVVDDAEVKEEGGRLHCGRISTKVRCLENYEEMP